MATAGNGRQQRAGNSTRPLRPHAQGVTRRGGKRRAGDGSASESSEGQTAESELPGAITSPSESPSAASAASAGASCCPEAAASQGEAPPASHDDPVAELKAMARARLGQTLRGKWTLDELLGVGGMASVYGATHRNGHRVAIKLLHPVLGANAVLRERFAREGYAANRVEHPGVPRVLDDDKLDDGTPFLVMELLTGETIEGRWRRMGRLLAPAEVLAIADELLAALGAAHARGILHRDVKPDNVFLTKQGRIKVLDFGIAQVREGVPGGITATRTGALLGTPAYMSPEQARGRTRELDARSDVWAVGALMFTLLTGRHVHLSEFPNEMLIMAATERAMPLLEAWPGAPLCICAVVDRALAFERESRFDDAASMRSAIQAAQRELGVADTEESLRTAVAGGLVPAPPPPRGISSSGPTLASEAPPAIAPPPSVPAPPASAAPSALSIAPVSTPAPAPALSQPPSARARTRAWAVAAAAVMLPLGIILGLARGPRPHPVDPQASLSPAAAAPLAAEAHAEPTPPQPAEPQASAAPASEPAPPAPALVASATAKPKRNMPMAPARLKKSASRR